MRTFITQLFVLKIVGQNDQSKIKCYHCGKLGHLIRDCRSRLAKLKNNPKSIGNEGKRSFANITCYKCSKKGHIARNCRSNNEAVKAAEETDSKDTVELDEDEEINNLRN